jgi:oligoxyloglucan reducing-end-specific cellobiohydrolase
MRLYSLIPVLLLGLVSGNNDGTADYTYEYNAVAVTGGGYITGIIAHPSERDLMYARTDIGSTYRWNVTLNKWIPLTDFISEADSNLFGTEAIALDPTNPSMLYLAQGRYLSSNNSAFFVSSDQGESFDIHPAPFPMGANELGRNNGERLAVNPFKPQELYFGTRTEGLWKSEDGAKTWSNVTAFPDAFANTIGITFVIFDPEINGTVYAGATAPEGLYCSTDGGVSWSKLPGQPSSWTNLPPNATTPLSTAPQPMKAVLRNDTMYITYGDSPGPYGLTHGAVYSLNTSSQVWKDITPNANNSSPPPFFPQSLPIGGYCGISVSHSDPNTLVVTSLDRDPGPALDSLYLSRDGGGSWVDLAQISTPEGSGGYWGHPIEEAALDNGTAVPWLSFNWAGGWNGYGAPSPIQGLAKFGWWMTALLMSPWDDNRVMYGTGATIWATDDLVSAASNMTSPNWYIKAQGIEETFCLAMTSPKEGAHLISGFGDINGFKHDDLDAPQPMLSLPVYSNTNGFDYAGNQPSTLVRVGQNQLPQNASTGCRNAAVSHDGGDTWSPVKTCQPLINSTFTDAGTIAIDAAGTCLVWSAGSTPIQGNNVQSNVSGPYFSPDNGATWQSPVGLGIQTPNITSDKVQSGTFYSYTSGVWYLSTDGGKTYSNTTGSTLGLPSIGALPVVDFDHAGHVYLPLGRYGVWFTSDFGSSWTQVTPQGVLPVLFTLGAAPPHRVHPSCYLWGDVNNTTGLYRSDDNGSTWARINDDAHQYGGPTLIQGDPRVYGRVYMGTGGRGILRADIVGSKGGVRKGTGGI